jgi:large repetitive protein
MVMLRHPLVWTLGIALSAAVAACGGSDSSPSPTIASIEPTPICATATSFTIHGSDFQNDATVTIDGAAPASATVGDNATITVAVAATSLSAGMHAVVVTNPDGKTGQGTLTVEAQPLMFFVDPPVVWNGAALKVTLFMSGLQTTVTGATMQLRSDASPNPNPVVTLTGITGVTGHPDQVQAILPEGLPAGVYDLAVTDGTCTAALASGVTVIDSTDITLTAITPPFGSNTENTAVEIDAATPGDPPFGFTATPRVYLSQHGSAGAATALRAVTYVSPTQITAVVPVTDPPLPPGDYDVIVVDPADSAGKVHVGVLSGSATTGFHVLATPPPVITDVTPQSLSTTGPITITGTGFVTAAGTSRSRVTLSCELAGVKSTIDVTTITYTSTTSLSATLATVPAAGTVCVVRVSNGDPADLATPYADFSAISFTTASGNLNAWQCSKLTGACPATAGVVDLHTPRRALQLVEGRVNATTRFLYAIGGDGGTKEGALASVEASKIGLYGEMSAFAPQASAMAEKRTLFGAVRIADFIYVLGGYGGTSTTAPLTTVERAQILDPLDVPQTPDLGLTPSATGVAKGTWVYRISAVRAATDPSNPGGETLPSDPLDVIIPDLSAVTPTTPQVSVTLSWPVMPGVASYNVYRTAASGEGTDQVKVIGTVEQPATGTTVTFTDSGAAATGGSPLPIGSLGAWHVVTDGNVATGAPRTLTVGRVGGAVVSAHAGVDAGNDVYWLYIAGGAATTPTPAAGTPATWSNFADSYEYAKISIDATSKVQTVGAFTASSASLGGGRALASAWAVDSHIVPGVPAGTTYVYFGDGAATGTALGSVTETTTPSFTVVAKTAGNTSTMRGMVASTSSGDLGTLTTVSSEAHPAAASLAIEHYLFGFGGMSTTLNNQSNSALVNGDFSLGAWNANGTNNLPAGLALEGAAVESAFIYLAGGTLAAGGATPTTTVMRTIW